MLWSLLFISLIGNAHLDDHEKALCKTQNLILNGTTSQSSDYHDKGVNYTSERAVDGNWTKCAHTLQQHNSWWRIDLQGVYSISCIKIYNVEQDNAIIDGAQIYIGNSRENNGTANRLCKTITGFELDDWFEVKCKTDMSGRYITVILPENRHLILCELQIYGKIKESPFVLIKKNKTWEDALYYCMDRNMDLASIVDQKTQAWAELEAKNAQTPFVWLGLRYTCTLEFWFWANDQRVEFDRWAPEGKIEECDMSGAMETQGDHLWSSKPDYKTFNFICAKRWDQDQCSSSPDDSDEISGEAETSQEA